MNDPLYRCPRCGRHSLDPGLCVKCWDSEATAKRDPAAWRPRFPNTPDPSLPRMRFWMKVPDADA